MSVLALASGRGQRRHKDTPIVKAFAIIPSRAQVTVQRLGEPLAPRAARPPAQHQPHHRWIDHTGELHLQVEAQTLELLFEQAGRALAEIQLERAENGALGASLRVDLTARDRAALLAAWLNELIFLSEIHKQVFTELHVERVTEVHLTAHVQGVAVACLRTIVKAATMHELSVEATPDGYAASVVLDV